MSVSNCDPLGRTALHLIEAGREAERSGDAREARGCFEAAAAIDAAPLPCLELGHLLARAEQPRDAIDAFLNAWERAKVSRSIVDRYRACLEISRLYRTTNETMLATQYHQLAIQAALEAIEAGLFTDLPCELRLASAWEAAQHGDLASSRSGLEVIGRQADDVRHRVEARLLLSRLDASESRFSAALRWVRLASREARNASDPTMMLEVVQCTAEIFCQMKCWPQASRLLEEAEKMSRRMGRSSHQLYRSTAARLRRAMQVLQSDPQWN